MGGSRLTPKADIIKGMEASHKVGLLVRLLWVLVLVSLLGLAARSRQVTLHMQEAEQALSSGLPLVASQHVADAARRLPWRADLWELAGRYALQGGDYKTAIRYLEQANQNSSTNHFSTQDDLSIQGLTDLGDAYHGAGNLPSAILAWQQAVAIRGSSSGLAERLAEAYLALGDYPAAMAELETLIFLQPDDAQAHYRLGLLIASEDPELALEHLKIAIGLDPALETQVSRIRRAVLSARFAEDQAYTLLAAGRALASLGEWELAEEAFREATLVRPEFAEAWAYLGESRQHLSVQGELSEEGDGLAEIRKALELDPGSLAAHTFLALYWTRRAQYDLALESIRSAISLDPKSPVLYSELGRILAQSGNLYGAFSAYQQAIVLAPDDLTYTRLLVEFTLKYNFRIEQVTLPLARRLVILDPQDAANLDTMAKVLIELGDLAGAERFLSRALMADPDYAPAHLHMGLVHSLREDQAAALIEFRLAASLAPQSPTGEHALRMMETYLP